MINIDNNRLRMYIVLLAFLDGTNAIWSVLASMVTNVGKFRAVVLLIQGTQAIAARLLHGYTVTLAGVQKEMIEETLKMCAAVKTYALGLPVPDMILWGSVDFNINKLMEGGQVLLNGRCLNVYLIANGLGVLLIPEGIIGTELIAQNLLIAQHLVLIPGRNAQGAASKAANSDLVDEFKQAGGIVKDLLTANALQFKKSQGTWYKGFLNAKRIANLGTHVTSFSMLVTNALTSQFLKGVTVVITGYALTPDYLTGKTGKLLIMPAVPGIYTITVSMVGYETQVFTNVGFIEAEGLVLNVALKPL